jgi:hypothetical protein
MIVPKLREPHHGVYAGFHIVEFASPIVHIALQERAIALQRRHNRVLDGGKQGKPCLVNVSGLIGS